LDGEPLALSGDWRQGLLLRWRTTLSLRWVFCRYSISRLT
ncbi:translocase subunit SecF domain protein, partial [Escherichia coli P0304777.5]